MSPQLKDLLANIGHAAFNGGPTRIGSGVYTPEELRVVLAEVKDMAAALAPKPKPTPWTLNVWHDRYPNNVLIMQGDVCVTSPFVVSDGNRERLERAIKWLNEQEN